MSSRTTGLRVNISGREQERMDERQTLNGHDRLRGI